MTPKQVADWREALGGTRFLLTVGCSAINSMFFISGALTENGYLSILGGTVFAYIAAATTQAVTRGRDANVQPN